MARRGLHLPIDSFLISLAEDRGDQAIGVILSGMGSDGTAGLAAIRRRGGLALVQTPETAKFDAMPRSAINAGFCRIRIAMTFNHAITPTPISPSVQAIAALWYAPKTTMPMMPSRSSKVASGCVFFTPAR